MGYRVYPIFRRTFGRRFFTRPDGIVGYENIPEKGPFVLAANHVGFGLLDGFIIGAQVIKKIDQPVHFISHQSYFKFPLGRRIANYTYTILINKNISGECLMPAINQLKKGGIVAIFPEGHRNSHQDLLLGHTGVARLALGAKVPVLPVGLFAPITTNPLNSLFHIFRKKAKIKIVFGRPISFDEYYQRMIDKKLLREVTNRIMRAIGQLCNKRYPYN